MVQQLCPPTGGCPWKLGAVRGEDTLADLLSPTHPALAERKTLTSEWTKFSMH